MIDKSRELIELLNSYQNHNENSENNHEHHDHEHHEHHRYHEHHEENIVSNNDNGVKNLIIEKDIVPIKNMERSDVKIEKCEYLIYNNYKYRREVLSDGNITWEIERIAFTSSNSSYNVSVFYRIFHSKQIEVLERKYNELNAS
jgi:hypothetical protein